MPRLCGSYVTRHRRYVIGVCCGRHARNTIDACRGAIQIDVETGPQPPIWKFGVRRLAAAVVAGRIPETTAGASSRTPNSTCPFDTLPHQFESHPACSHCSAIGKVSVGVLVNCGPGAPTKPPSTLSRYAGHKASHMRTTLSRALKVGLDAKTPCPMHYRGCVAGESGSLTRDAINQDKSKKLS
jgi:hypothetical protein